MAGQARGARIVSSPYHPQTCGKKEREWQGLHRWLDAHPAAASIAELQRLVDAYDARVRTTNAPITASAGSLPSAGTRRPPRHPLTATARAERDPTVFTHVRWRGAARWSGGCRAAGRLGGPPRCSDAWPRPPESQSATPPHPTRCAGDTQVEPAPRTTVAQTTASEARLVPPLSPSARRRVCLRPIDDETQVNTPMPNKASGPKKARWSSAQKSEARKAPKKAHHRGQPDGPKSAPKRSARPDSGRRLHQATARRALAALGPRGPAPPGDSRGSRYSAGPSDRDNTSNRDDNRGSRYSSGPSDRGNTSNRTTNPSNRDDRNDRPKRWVSDSREERHVHRPHDERPRLERGERPVRDRAPRVADPARRDRHEGRRADPTSDRGGYQGRDDRGTSGGYQGRRRPWHLRWLPGPRRPRHLRWLPGPEA